MLQSIRASTLTMPNFGHDMSLAGMQNADADAWNWPQPTASHQPSYSSSFDPSLYSSFTPQLQNVSRAAAPRHHSIATTHSYATGTNTPPPARPQVAGSVVKAQPAFKPTWQGFLDTTKDAMTIVEASLRGQLSHISRRPHDKERAEMLTSGTVLVYEENASGIKRWTDAVHWSPSRVMNNCLIYRQLVRALKPEEKKSALNPSCGTKRKRKESTGPAVTKTGDQINGSDDEYENPSYDGSMNDPESMTKVYANYAQTLTPDQQRRFCGSLIDSYEFKEGGLMKKTISVKYQGTHHHVISYYSLEDVVNGKLKRPFQDPKLADIQPRRELLNGWKVSLEDEENKDLPLVPGYPHHVQPSHLQHHVMGPATQGLPGHAMIQTQTPLQMSVPEYWHGSPVTQYPANHHNPQGYASQSASTQYATQPSQQYTPQQPASQHFPQPPSPQQYSSPQTSTPQFATPAVPQQPYAAPSQAARHYSFDQAQTTQAPSYPQAPPASQYQPTHHQAQSGHFAVPQAAGFDMNISISQAQSSTQQISHTGLAQHELSRRASAPVVSHTYTSQYPSAPYPNSYYVTDAKYVPEVKHTPNPNHGY